MAFHLLSNSFLQVIH